MSYLDEWERSVAARAELSASARSRMCISRETLEGLRITGINYIYPLYYCHRSFVSYTVKSLVELTRYVLQLPDVHYFLSVKLCQDPLESFFGKQRMRGGHCDNPTVQTFLCGTSSLRVQGSVAQKPIHGNCKRG